MGNPLTNASSALSLGSGPSVVVSLSPSVCLVGPVCPRGLV